MSGHGGAPYWVQKEEDAIRFASRQSQQLKLEDRIKELEAENARLRKELGEMKAKYEGAIQGRENIIP